MSLEGLCVCGARLVAPDRLAGRRVKCRKCGAILTVPMPEPNDEGDGDGSAEDSWPDPLPDGFDSDASEGVRGVFDETDDREPSPPRDHDRPSNGATRDQRPGVTLLPEPWFIWGTDVAARCAALLCLVIGTLLILGSLSSLLKEKNRGDTDWGVTHLIAGTSLVVAGPLSATPMLIGIAIYRELRMIRAGLGLEIVAVS